MKHFFLVENPEKAHVAEVAEYLENRLREYGAECLRFSAEKPHPGSGYKYTDQTRIPERMECAIILGGDGTMIQAARDLAGRNIPMLGINLGTLGYLTQVNRMEELPQVLEDLLQDHFTIKDRMMLTGKVEREGRMIREELALNEMVIARNGPLRIVRFKVYVNEIYLNEYAADGIIIATPTGSTAYNLSAGGPVVSPDTRMLVLTPICAHALSNRSVVLSAEDRIRVEVLESSSQWAVFDGDEAVELPGGSAVTVTGCSMVTRMIQLKDVSFMDHLREKMQGI